MLVHIKQIKINKQLMTQVNDSSGLFQRLSGRKQPENYPVMP
jgi:hypothetical protein